MNALSSVSVRSKLYLMEQQSLFEIKPLLVEGLFHCLPILILKIKKKKQKTLVLCLKTSGLLQSLLTNAPHPTLLMIRLHLQEPARSAGSEWQRIRGKEKGWFHLKISNIALLSLSLERRVKMGAKNNIPQFCVLLPPPSKKKKELLLCIVKLWSKSFF